MVANDFISANHIIAEVVSIVGDRDFRKSGFSTGWYMSRVQDALQELAFDTFYQEVTLDYDIPENLRLEIPKNVFNVREIYIYNGDSCCGVNDSQIVHYKRTFNNKNGGYTARVKESGTNASPFVPTASENSLGHDYSLGVFNSPKYYANIQNGTLMLSSHCSGYSKIRIVCNGMGAAVGDVPIIPRFFERAIVDYLEERWYNSMKSLDPRMYNALWRDARDKMYDWRDGSWRKAISRVASMDSWEKEDMNEYLSAIFHK